jgi:hypothetical protein
MGKRIHLITLIDEVAAGTTFPCDTEVAGAQKTRRATGAQIADYVAENLELPAAVRVEDAAGRTHPAHPFDYDPIRALFRSYEPVTFRSHDSAPTDPPAKISMYTVPAGKVLILSHFWGTNQSGSTRAMRLYARSGATDYLVYRQNFSNNFTSHVALNLTPYLEGEEVVFEADGSNMTGQFHGWLGELREDVTIIDVRGPTAGENVLYTCPPGRHAEQVNVSALVGLSSHELVFGNAGLSSETFTAYHTRDGETALGLWNRITSALTVAANTTAMLRTGFLGPGERIVATVATGGSAQIVRGLVVEYPAEVP